MKVIFVNSERRLTMLEKSSKINSSEVVFAIAIVISSLILGFILLIVDQTRRIESQNLRMEVQNEVIIRTLYGEKYSRENIEALFKKN
ncbi:MAG: hypothetical protein Q8N63_09170 [Nanoarchaeota archaeon]|nr:hypothetical protein [Nanoarchaeota archaeon]